MERWIKVNRWEDKHTRFSYILWVTFIFFLMACGYRACGDRDHQCFTYKDETQTEKIEKSKSLKKTIENLESQFKREAFKASYDTNFSSIYGRWKKSIDSIFNVISYQSKTGQNLPNDSILRFIKTWEEQRKSINYINSVLNDFELETTNILDSIGSIVKRNIIIPKKQKLFIALAIDVSGSIDTSICRKALKDIFKELKEDDKILIYYFASKARGEYYINGVRVFDNLCANKAIQYSIINNACPDSNTSLDTGATDFIELINTIRRDQPNYIDNMNEYNYITVFLTDFTQTKNILRDIDSTMTEVARLYTDNYKRKILSTYNIGIAKFTIFDLMTVVDITNPNYTANKKETISFKEQLKNQSGVLFLRYGTFNMKYIINNLRMRYEILVSTDDSDLSGRVIGNKVINLKIKSTSNYPVDIKLNYTIDNKKNKKEDAITIKQGDNSYTIKTDSSHYSKDRVSIHFDISDSDGTINHANVNYNSKKQGMLEALLVPNKDEALLYYSLLPPDYHYYAYPGEELKIYVQFVSWASDTLLVQCLLDDQDEHFFSIDHPDTIRLAPYYNYNNAGVDTTFCIRLKRAPPYPPLDEKKTIKNLSLHFTYSQLNGKGEKNAFRIGRHYIPGMTEYEREYTAIGVTIPSAIQGVAYNTIKFIGAKYVIYFLGYGLFAIALFYILYNYAAYRMTVGVSSRNNKLFRDDYRNIDNPTLEFFIVANIILVAIAFSSYVCYELLVQGHWDATSRINRLLIALSIGIFTGEFIKMLVIRIVRIDMPRRTNRFNQIEHVFKHIHLNFSLAFAGLILDMLDWF